MFGNRDWGPLVVATFGRPKGVRCRFRGRYRLEHWEFGWTWSLPQRSKWTAEQRLWGLYLMIENIGDSW